MQPDRRDIGQQKRHQRACRRHICPQNDLAGGIGCVIHRLCPHGIGPLALGNGPDAHHRGRGAKRVDNLGQGDAVEGQLGRIDENPHFLVATAIEGDFGHAVHAAKRLDDLCFKEIAKPFEINRLPRLGDKRKPGNRAVIGI